MKFTYVKVEGAVEYAIIGKSGESQLPVHLLTNTTQSARGYKTFCSRKRTRVRERDRYKDRVPETARQTDRQNRLYLNE